MSTAAKKTTARAAYPTEAVSHLAEVTDRMHGLLMERADALMDCTENSPEEAELAALTDVIEAYECQRRPLAGLGHVWLPTGRSRMSRCFGYPSEKADHIRAPALVVSWVPRTVILRIPIHHRKGELIGLDVCGLDHGCPFFDFGLVVRGKRLRSLVGKGHDFLPDLGNSLLHSWVAQRLDYGRAKSLA